MLTAERAPDAPLDHVPRGTTPTWEMELLLSGATVFGLLQLPGAIDPFFVGVIQRADDVIGPNLVAIWTYVKGAVLTLSVTFVAHLALRAYWVALVGMRSVYPGGLRWEKLRVATVQRAALEPIAGDIPARIEAADNRASRVFAIGVAVALILLVPLVVVALGVVVSYLVGALGGPDLSRWAVMGGAFLVMGPFFLAAALDRVVGKRVAPGGRTWRALAAVFRGYHRVGFGTASNPLLAMFQSHVGMVRTMGVVFGTMAVIFSVVVMQLMTVLGDDAPFGDFAGLPDSDPGALETAQPEYYATQRQGQLLALPYLQDRVVRGPYVELFVPYRPGRHAPAMRAACGEAVAVVESEGPPAEALACLARILDVRLDGAPVAVPLQATTDPVTGMRGVLAMIPAAELAPGRHELTIVRLGRKDRPEPPKPFRIPFWR